MLSKICKLYSLYVLHWKCRNQKLQTRKPITQMPGVIEVSGLDVGSLKIGKNSHLKTPAYIECSGSVEIGDNVHFAGGLTIFSTNHNWRSENAVPYDSKIITKPVIIEDCVWIGANVTILPGTHIEEGVVIGAGSIVNGRISSGSVLGANIAAIIAHRDLKVYHELKNAGKVY